MYGVRVYVGRPTTLEIAGLAHISPDLCPASPTSAHTLSPNATLSHPQAVSKQLLATSQRLCEVWEIVYSQ